MQTSSAKSINEHLRRRRKVTVEDQDGAKFCFEIQPVSMALWDPKNEWYARLMGADPKGLQERIAEEITCPSLDVMREVVLSGVLEPEVAKAKPQDPGKHVWVEDLLRKDMLARRLYSEIANYAFAGIAKIEATDAETRPPS